MEISVLGSGAMGSYFGGVLAENGHRVTLIDIDDVHLNRIRTDGLLLETGSGERHIKNLDVSRPEHVCGAPDLLIVFTKALHTHTALDSLRPVLAETKSVLTLQNGLGNVETINEFVPLESLLVGVTTWPADKLGAGRVASHGDGKIKMMSADGVHRPHVDKVANALNSASLNCIVDDNVWAAIWEKVAFNAALNSLCAVSGCSVDQLGIIPDGIGLALKIVDEVLSVATGIGFEVDAAQCRLAVQGAIEKHRGHKPSMLQDILAGRRTEIESINGAVVEAARKANVSVPFTQTLLSLVRLIQERHAR